MPKPHRGIVAAIKLILETIVATKNLDWQKIEINISRHE